VGYKEKKMMMEVLVSKEITKNSISEEGLSGWVGLLLRSR
jgi:hypothetical protein